MTKPDPRTRLSRKERKKLADVEHARKLYQEEGLSIRQIADELQRSYGYTHALLTQAGVEFYPRGGDQATEDAFEKRRQERILAWQEKQAERESGDV